VGRAYVVRGIWCWEVCGEVDWGCWEMGRFGMRFDLGK
jgi:hypothetical protein